MNEWNFTGDIMTIWIYNFIVTPKAINFTIETIEFSSMNTLCHKDRDWFYFSAISVLPDSKKTIGNAIKFE